MEISGANLQMATAKGFNPERTFFLQRQPDIAGQQQLRADFYFGWMVINVLPPSIEI